MRTKYKDDACCLSPESILRKWAIYVIHSSYFEPIMFIIIMLNCLFIGLGADQDVTNWSDIYFASEVFFAFTFTAEMFLKQLAMGLFVSEHAYFRDPLNIFDFVLVLICYTAFIDSIRNLVVFRVFRVFRALKMISSQPSLRVMIFAFARGVWATVPVTISYFILHLTAAVMFLIFFRGKVRRLPLTRPPDPLSSPPRCPLPPPPFHLLSSRQI